MINKWYRKIKYYLVRLFRMKNGAKQIAVGIVLGFFPCWFPTFGIGLMLSIAITKFAKGNMPSAIISASLGSFLWPVLFYLNYKVGSVFYSISTKVPDDIEYDEHNYIEPIEQVNTWDEIGFAFLTGSIINSLLFSLAGYFICLYLFGKYRETILKQLTKRA